jgi:predicted transcriptional regulator
MTTDKQTLLIRLRPETKAALRKAALAEQRSMAFMAEKAIAEWLRQSAKRKPRP